MAENIESVFTQSNISMALHHIARRKRMPGIDGVNVSEVIDLWKSEGERILETIVDGTYKTTPFLEVHIPKKDNNYRKLQIPSTMDRVIAEVIRMKITDQYDSVFSENSFGFRKNRGAQDAIKMSKRYMNQGCKYVVDLDIKNFFDSVNHKRLRCIMQMKGEQEKFLNLLSQFYAPYVAVGRHVYKKYRGLPQGCCLSPVLANIYLNQLDWYLEDKRYCFTRYADDLLIFSENEQQAKKILMQVQKYLQKELYLELNAQKTAIRKCEDVIFLGYAFRKIGKQYVCAISEKTKWDALCKTRKAICRKENNVQEIWNEIGRFNRGWVNYYKMVEPNEFISFAETVDSVQKYYLENFFKALSEENKKKVFESLYESKEYSSFSGWYKKITGGQFLWKIQ